MIAAIGKNNELGKDNNLLWHIKEDMAFFKNETMGKKILMGMKTFESLPGLLKGREHIVLTRQNILLDNVKIFHSKEDVITYLKKLKEEVMIIGGACIYKEFIEYANKLILTEIDEEKEADAYFPYFDKNKWDATLINEFKGDINYKRMIYKRKNII